MAVAQALQRARGLDDSEVRFFVGADEPESYTKVPSHSTKHFISSYFIL